MVDVVFDFVYGEIKSVWICRVGNIIVNVMILVNIIVIIVFFEKFMFVEVGFGFYSFEYVM